MHAYWPDINDPADDVIQFPAIYPPATARQSRAGASVRPEIGSGLWPGESLVCARCVAEAGDDVRGGLLGEPGTGTAVLRPEELADVEEITAEEEYAAALAGEVVSAQEPDGTPVVESDDPARLRRVWPCMARAMSDVSCRRDGLSSRVRSRRRADRSRRRVRRGTRGSSTGGPRGFPP